MNPFPQCETRFVVLFVESLSQLSLICQGRLQEVRSSNSDAARNERSIQLYTGHVRSDEESPGSRNAQANGKYHSQFVEVNEDVKPPLSFIVQRSREICFPVRRS